MTALPAFKAAPDELGKAVEKRCIIRVELRLMAVCDPHVRWLERWDDLAASVIGGVLILRFGEIVTSQAGTDKSLTNLLPLRTASTAGNSSLPASDLKT